MQRCVIDAMQTLVQGITWSGPNIQQLHKAEERMHGESR